MLHRAGWDLLLRDLDVTRRRWLLALEAPTHNRDHGLLVGLGANLGGHSLSRMPEQRWPGTGCGVPKCDDACVHGSTFRVHFCDILEADLSHAQQVQL